MARKRDGGGGGGNDGVLLWLLRCREDIGTFAKLNTRPLHHLAPFPWSIPYSSVPIKT